MKLDSAASLVGRKDDLAAQDITECIRLTQDSINEMRTVSYLLYPPMLEEMGLKSAIPWYLDGFSARSGIKTTFTGETDFGRLPRDSELALFRVLQESLTNVHRHSESKAASIRLAVREGAKVLEIEDDGKGIPQELLNQAGEAWMSSLGVGVRGMNERMRQLGGKLEILRRKERGTLVRASLLVDSLESKPK
jgi:signal transduction histidine kinase